MTAIFRVMMRENGYPKTGEAARCLGVRIPPSVPYDIAPDANNNQVNPGKGGMSVTPSIECLPKHRIPKRLKNYFPEATGNNNDSCWRLKDVQFTNCQINDDLILTVNNKKHALIEPKSTMDYLKYKKALEDTKLDWLIDEP